MTTIITLVDFFVKYEQGANPIEYDEEELSS